jgi:thioredoxin reductase (NADPH)
MEYFVYIIPGLFILGYYLVGRRKLHKVSVETRKEAVEAGLTEPASLHPLIDAAQCIGCGACVAACPESPAHTVIGLIDGKAQLVSPTSCIGHGACRAACPVGAIELVFGTATRGVDLPKVSDTFESNVPGVYIAGELGGMGLIRNAVEQGRQAVDSIVKSRPRNQAPLDLVIVGAGPAGFSASLAAKAAGLRFETIEQESLGGCVFQYPRGKIVMTQPAVLPIVGKVKMTLTSKEDLLAFWQDAERRTGLKLRYQERVDEIRREGDLFVVRTTKGEYKTSTVLLSVGRRGTPRKLGVPGEELPKVVYRLIEAEQYAGRRVLVVGGGDSALEAAASCAEAGAASVTLSYRGEAFQRAKARNRERVAAAEKTGRLKILLGSTVSEILEDRVVLKAGGNPIAVPNDAVIVNAGGVLPNEFLKSIGIDVVTKWGEA